jgi:hypothetical protein
VKLICWLHAAILTGLTACQPDTTRPAIVPLPEAATTEVRLPVQEATRLLAEALRADSIPALRVRLRDGYIESRWFEAATGRPTNKRPLGLGIVRIRAWADPARPGDSQLRVETLYRPLADPSLPERELERQVPPNHPIAIKIRSTLQDLVKRYGGPPSPEAKQPAAPTEEEAPDE